MYCLIVFVISIVQLISLSKISAVNSFTQKRETLIKWAKRENLTDALETQLAYFAVCAVVKDEQLDVREWIQYHIFFGVGKIYLFDNGSKPPLIDFIQDFVDSGKVDYFYFTKSFEADDFEQTRDSAEGPIKSIRRKNSAQVWSYSSCMTWFGHRHQFIGLIDADEFFILNDKSYKSIAEYLKTFKKNGGINVYRRFFGSSGHIERPQKTVLESYTQCSEDFQVIEMQNISKQIVNMDFYNGRCMVHFCSLKRPAVNTHRVEANQKNIASEKYLPTWDGLMINHYFIKSLEDFKRKQARGVGHKFQGRVEVTRSDGFFNDTNKQLKAECNYAIELGQRCCSDINPIDSL